MLSRIRLQIDRHARRSVLALLLGVVVRSRGRHAQYARCARRAQISMLDRSPGPSWLRAPFSDEPPGSLTCSLLHRCPCCKFCKNCTCGCCAGQACCRRPVQLPLTRPPAVAPLVAQEWACLAYQTVSASPDRDFCFSTPTQATPVHFSQTVYHPPRST